MCEDGFSFIIVTDGNQGPRLKTVVESIVREVPEERREIIIVGGENGIDSELISRYNVLYIPFCESEFPNSIGKKKNVGVRAAKFDRLVISHDYIECLPGFIQNWDEFGDEWDIGMNQILNMDGSRYRDWIVFFNTFPEAKIHGNPWVQQEPWQSKPRYYRGSPYLLDYSKPYADMISGAFWLAKRYVMLEEPILEIPWGFGEDCNFSERVIPKYKYMMNLHSKVKLLKSKPVIFKELV